ncbi:ATP-dependent helicase [Romboutsia sp. 1001216sp1]|uniref:ATP-dependent helicase n=1 Tax=unclassified Romboutsia TaxID=2626894 RepID=UPI0018A0DFF5|nr:MULTISPECIES: ATP-dependent helicase [unclassified Romboutsia]MDB8789568.1 ATP-dependent helicase [Romboutsia sp. 1001216sp1]MDB8793826.1 ATP-dependent helicase [Romboutsia sp. 1001216sp1]MDB8796715.1 ATP-dependent helicase [Romboutsia sp. 1001216sp1]MDB8799920.1 ATP-dependent helicase [Romboutsia sp. 1001216sp1]MDB8802711.1 ATP-dependent helicase [Romboutsia sp. 1001216sp1]
MISIDKLNENQKVAVEHVDGPCMVLAGPGSGKTRVITYRIANMVVNKGISPRSILAISFTKASSVEMKNRALSLSDDHRMNKVTYGTFHSVFFRILRYFEKYSLDNIFDEKSKRLLLKGILKSLNIENADDDETIGQVINEISYVKNELMDIRDFTSELLTSDEFLKTYNLYEEHKNQHNKIDFDDMLIKTYHLLKHNKSALDMVRGIYRYILVDEFQDINKVQFEVLKLIANPNNNIFVVGDEDQSIYGFRGARPDFLLEFEQYFKGTKKVLLDINYRSKDEIINIANRLIEKNENRYEKVIKCHQGEGGNVKYISPNDSEEEAVFIAKDILEEMKKDYVEYTDFAVIYRTNIQSRALVDVFMDMRIPFIVKDSIITIYDHWASQDILAYLRIGVNPDSNKDWVRIINKPFRYISKEHVNMVKDEKNFINALINKCNLHPKQVKTINDLDIDLSYLKTLNPKNAISYIRTSLDYDRYILDYCTNRKIKTNGLIEILNELESSATNFNTIQEYLDHIERVKSELIENKNNQNSDGVIFTTMHSAKGLEFKNVYIIGATEGTIPHEKSYDINDEEKKVNQIEEERRLMYVAITRAEENIYISSPSNKYGKKVSKSRFIDDIKGATKKEIESLTIGDKIYHKRFKEGTIVQKNNNLVKVKFSDGERTLDYKVCSIKNVIYKI